jgi:hypothetical protein
MSRYFFLTKTRWDEQPRLRHQLARLLADAGNEVLFFEKPRYLWQAMSRPRQPENNVTLIPHRHLMHHKLRLTSSLQLANATVIKDSLKSSMVLLDVSADDVIVNFNFDYWFLRDIFPENRIITIINDDFISDAPLGYEKHLRWAMARTCSSSDRVLTVSVPLQEQLSAYCKPELFLPWADCAYRKPCHSSRRDTLLYWGYINKRVDFRLVRDFAEQAASVRPNIRLLFAGPVQDKLFGGVRSLGSARNIQIVPPAGLEELVTDRVLAGFLPYRANVRVVDACTLPNRGLRLLARGLPLLISGLPALPHFMKAPFIVRMDAGDIAKSIDTLLRQFDDMQPAIQAFVSRNGAEVRLRQFLELLD